MDKYDLKKQEAITVQKSLKIYYSNITSGLFEFCKLLSRFRQNKYYYLVGDYDSFSAYCWDNFKMSRTSADRYALVGQFLREFQPADLNQSMCVSLENFENLSICKLYLLASAYFCNQDLFKKLITLDVVHMTYKELSAEFALWKSMLVVKQDVEFVGDVQELRDSIETVANEISVEKVAQTSGSSAAYDDNTKTYINGVMSLRSECERMYRFLESVVGSEVFGRATIYRLLFDLIHACDDDLNKFMG